MCRQKQLRPLPSSRHRAQINDAEKMCPRSECARVQPAPSDIHNRCVARAARDIRASLEVTHRWPIAPVRSRGREPRPTGVGTNARTATFVAQLYLNGASNMRKVISAAVLSGFVAAFSLAAYAQSTPAPTGPADCKATDRWDEATKTCKPK